MTVTVKSKTPLVVPPSIWRRAGIKPGDKIEFTATGGVITIAARAEEDADDEYTPAQRRKILAGCRQGMKEIAEGRFYGPFESSEELKACIEAEVKKRAAKQPKRAK